MQLEIALAELRELRGASQTQIADSLGTSRPNVGRIEKEIDVRLSTLERYVEALGGKLEIHAVFDDADIKLSGSSPRPGHRRRVAAAARCACRNIDAPHDGWAQRNNGAVVARPAPTRHQPTGQGGVEQ